MFYRVADLAMICSTSPEVIVEAATICGKKPLAGALVFRPSIPVAFIEEIHRIRDMRQREAQRRGHDSTIHPGAHDERAAA